MGSKSNVSGFFRLQFRNGLGTKPAGVLLFRTRVPNTFFLSFAWWLAGFQVLRCAKVCLAVSHGLGTISLFLVGATFGDFSGCSFAMAWAQNLLGFCFFACVSPSDGPAVLFRDDVGAILVEDFRPFSLFLVGSKSNVSAFFWLRFRMAWALFLCETMSERFSWRISGLFLCF